MDHSKRGNDKHHNIPWSQVSSKHRLALKKTWGQEHTITSQPSPKNKKPWTNLRLRKPLRRSPSTICLGPSNTQVRKGKALFSSCIKNCQTISFPPCRDGRKLLCDKRLSCSQGIFSCCYFSYSTTKATMCIPYHVDKQSCAHTCQVVGQLAVWTYVRVDRGKPCGQLCGQPC